MCICVFVCDGLCIILCVCVLCRYNKLAEIPGSLCECVQLEEISLDSNLLHSLPVSIGDDALPDHCPIHQGWCCLSQGSQ